MAQNNGSKILLVVKNRRFNVFYRLSLNRGEKGKNSPLKPRHARSLQTGFVGAYFAKMGCKIEDGITDIFRGCRPSSWMVQWSVLSGYCPWAANLFMQPKEK